MTASIGSLAALFSSELPDGIELAAELVVGATLAFMEGSATLLPLWWIWAAFSPWRPVLVPSGGARQLCGVPEISRFFGIIVAMYYDDHPPPHFHVRYGEHRAILAIEPVAVLAGALPPRALGLVMEWATLHRDDLWANWRRAREQAPLKSIAPLE